MTTADVGLNAAGALCSMLAKSCFKSRKKRKDIADYVKQ